MKPNHTPGPWRVNPEGFNEDCGSVIVSEDGKHSVVSAYGGQYCTGFVDMSEANAALIAAAPEMLQALKDIVDFFSDFDHEETIQKATHIISKAEGTNQ